MRDIVLGGIFISLATTIYGVDFLCATALIAADILTMSADHFSCTYFVVKTVFLVRNIRLYRFFSPRCRQTRKPSRVVTHQPRWVSEWWWWPNSCYYYTWCARYCRRRCVAVAVAVVARVIPTCLMALNRGAQRTRVKKIVVKRYCNSYFRSVLIPNTRKLDYSSRMTLNTRYVCDDRKALNERDLNQNDFNLKKSNEPNRTSFRFVPSS